MWNEGVKTYRAGEALEARRCVKLKSGTTTIPPEVVYADAGEAYAGVTEYAVSLGDPVAVKLKNCPGTFEMECLGAVAIAVGATLYMGNDGIVTDTVSGSAVGVAQESGVDNAIIEVLPA
jgi:hypothetical protein